MRRMTPRSCSCEGANSWTMELSRSWSALWSQVMRSGLSDILEVDGDEKRDQRERGVLARLKWKGKQKFG